MAIEGKDPKVILERLDSRLTMWLIGKLIEYNCLWFAWKILDKIVDVWTRFSSKNSKFSSKDRRFFTNRNYEWN